MKNEIKIKNIRNIGVFIFKYKRWLASLGSGLLLGLCFVVPILNPLFVFAFMLPLWLAITYAEVSRKTYLAQYYVMGVVYFSVVMFWMYNINATDLIQDSLFSNFFLVLTYLLVISSLGLSFLFFAGGWILLQAKTKNSLILLPFVWIISEALRSLLFSIIWFGPGGVVGDHWHFGKVGLTLINTFVGPAARIVGLYGLSLILLYSSIILLQIIRKKFAYTYLILPIILVIAGGTYGYKQGEGKLIDIISVSLASEWTDYTEINKKITKEGNIDLLVLPEYSEYFRTSTGEKTDYKLPANVQVAVDSQTKHQELKNSNVITLTGSRNTVIDQQQKTFLIPGGEYVPYVYEIVLRASGNTSLLQQTISQRSVSHDGKPEYPFKVKDVKFGSLACSAAIAPEFYRALTQQGATVLTNSASLSTLGVSDTYFKQAENLTRFSALANNRSFIQSARGGPAFMMNGEGKIEAYVQAGLPGNTDYIQHVVRPNIQKTIYTRFGEWTLWVTLTATALVLAFNSKVVGCIRRVILSNY